MRVIGYHRSVGCENLWSVIMYLIGRNRLEIERLVEMNPNRLVEMSRNYQSPAWAKAAADDAPAIRLDRFCW